MYIRDAYRISVFGPRDEGYRFRNGESDRYFYVVFDSLGATGDTVSVPNEDS